MNNIGFALVTSGEQLKYFKGVRLYGRFSEDGFIVYGCHKDDEPDFYDGVYRQDLDEPFMGFDSIQSVREYWKSGGDGALMIISEGYSQIHTGKPATSGGGICQ